LRYDVAGPFQIFFRASERYVELHPAAKAPYKVQLLSSTSRKSVQTNCGLVIGAAQPYQIFRAPIDTLLVAGGSAVEAAAEDRELLAWLAKTAKGVRRIGSICTGAFLLAAAGLLDGKRATTHWQAAAELAEKFRHIDVDPDPIRSATETPTPPPASRPWISRWRWSRKISPPVVEGRARNGHVFAQARRSVAVRRRSLGADFGPQADRGDPRLGPG
jgi:putative intracellular protease/amidase